jgi:hypothetical protein
MADAAAVDALVEEKISQMDSISTTALAGSQEFLDGMIANMTRAPIYRFITELPLELIQGTIDADEPDRPDIENLVDNTALPATEAIVMPLSPSDSDTELPAVVILEDISIPNDISVDNIELDPSLIFPADTMVDSDVNPFDYSETEYVSNLQDAVSAKLLYDVVNGGTGLDKDIEEAIFERQKERDEIELEKAIQRIRDEWSQNLFPLPNGALQAQIQDVYDKYELIALDRSRDIVIKQAELAQTNTHFALTSSIAMEAQLLQHADNVANRALDAAKSVVNLGISLFNIQLQRYQTALEAYRTGVQVFVERLRAEGLKVQNYTAQMQGAKVKADVQGQRISNYTGQIAAIGQIYDNYRIEVEAAGVKAGVEAEKLRAFKIKIEAEVDKVRALIAIYAADTDRYNSNVRKGAVDSELLLKQNDLISRNHEGNLKIAVETARMNLETFVKTAQMQINASLGGANAYTVLAAGAMDSINSVVQLGSTATVSATE